MEPSNPASSLSQLSKKRKVGEKKVVRVKIEDKANSNNGDQLPPPPDSWSWRKYGQKPIRGSPYPRGYYRCSTAKGCTARKRVERCRDDASVLLITYTSPHNHNHKKKLTNKERQIQSPTEETSASKVEEVKEEHEASYVITADRSAPSYSLYNSPISRLPYDIDDGSDFYNALHDLPF